MAYPTDPEFKTVGWKSNRSNLVSTTRSNRKQVRSIGSQFWSFTAKYNPMTRAEFAPVKAFVESQDGQAGEFEIVLPVISDTAGNPTSSPSVFTSQSAGISSVAVDSFSGTVKAGDFIRFDGHTKVYMLTADQTSTGNLSITPPLLSDVANNETVHVNNVAFTVRLARDVQSYGLTGYERYSYELDMEEVV